MHQDKDHLHVHIVTNSVSYIDGLKLHQTKHDLERQKIFTNDICLKRGLSITEKGKHFDGTAMEEGEIIAWSKDKYNLIKNETKKSYVAECAIAVLESKEDCYSRDDFIKRMEESGWHTSWSDSKKHITFQNDNGDKVRDSNLSKSFSLNISKEALTDEFERQNAMLSEYRTEPGRDAEALIREVRTDINDNRAQNRAVVNAENKSVAREKQSISLAEQRRLEEQRRALEQERARAIRRKKSRPYDMEL